MEVKLNLLLNGEDVLSGYINVDPYVDDDKQGKVQATLDNLDEFVDDAEAVEIRAVDILDFFPYEKSDALVNHWIKKLAHGGKLIIGVVELVEVAKGICNYSLDVDQANLFLHGEQKFDWQNRKANFTLSQIATYLESKGLKILKKRVSNYRCIVEAQRP